MTEKVPVQCWTPNTCDSKVVETTNATTSVQFDKITSPTYVDNCNCVEWLRWKTHMLWLEWTLRKV